MLGWAIALVGVAPCNGVIWEGRPGEPMKRMPANAKIDGWEVDCGTLISPVLGGLIRSGYVRRATAREDAMVRSAAMRRTGTGLSARRFYVVLKSIPPSALEQLNGGYMANFLLLKPTDQKRFVQTHSNFYTMAGKCVSGSDCDRCDDLLVPTFQCDYEAGRVSLTPIEAPPAPPKPRAKP